MNKAFIEKAYELAKQEYAEMGIDTDEALKKLDEIPNIFGLNGKE